MSTPLPSSTLAKSFDCYICGKAFRRRWNLQRYYKDLYANATDSAEPIVHQEPLYRLENLYHANTASENSENLALDRNWALRLVDPRLYEVPSSSNAFIRATLYCYERGTIPRLDAYVTQPRATQRLSPLPCERDLTQRSKQKHPRENTTIQE